MSMDSTNWLVPAVLRGLVYFGLVFGVGFLLGIVRVLVVEPRLGETWAELAEAPLMLVAIVVSARFVVRRMPAPHRAGYLVSGAAALFLLVLVEFSVVLAVRGLSLSEYVAERDPLAWSVYAVMLGIFAAMPWLLGGKQNSVREKV
jgi:hypothetical protein